MDGTARQLAVVTAAADVVEAELVDDETAGASPVVHAGRGRHLSPETVAAIQASVADSHPPCLRRRPRHVHRLVHEGGQNGRDHRALRNSVQLKVLTKTITRYGRLDLLCIDELG
ncbi:hypothetical protein ACH4D3_13795 [Streptomyces sp. NPDC018026]|uniref:hypothetical protein n=1 Tax=Streptomyces sp. NPDC018026 TaxID=3365031 RepID=UPI0037B65414